MRVAVVVRVAAERVAVRVMARAVAGTEQGSVVVAATEAAEKVVPAGRAAVADGDSHGELHNSCIRCDRTSVACTRWRKPAAAAVT